MTNVIPLHDPDEGVVEFGAKRSGYTAIVDGRAIPKLLVRKCGDDLITIQLDRRFEIDVPKELSASICWMIANALAIGEGYSHLGAESKDKPFAPQVLCIDSIT